MYIQLIIITDKRIEAWISSSIPVDFSIAFVMPRYDIDMTCTEAATSWSLGYLITVHLSSTESHDK
jgi:hypothetical protein